MPEISLLEGLTYILGAFLCLAAFSIPLSALAYIVTELRRQNKTEGP